MQRYPERALPSAERLGEIAPGAGHLVHMPSHMYLRVGHYHDATVANENAVKADQSYIAQCRAQGFYPAAYYPHNRHWSLYGLLASLRRQGKTEEANAVEKRFHDAWRLADVTLTASRL